MSSRRQRQILEIVRTDNTFFLEDLPHFGQAWCGKCFYCRTRLLVSQNGDVLNGGTVEHILSRNQGGDEELMNLALSCVSCNQEKGRRHDSKKSKVNLELLRAGQTERAKRWRESFCSH